MKALKTALILLLALLPLLLPAWPNYYTLSTANFQVYYRKGWSTEAMNLLQALEYSRPYVEGLTGNKPGRMPVLLEDMGNVVNGYASPVGRSMAVFAYPPSSDELALGEDWWQQVGIHEYIHMAQISKATGEPALLRALFGNILYPNLYQPMWMTEGITVYGESQLSKYGGRLNSGTYSAVINALASEGKLPNPGKAGYYSYSNPLGNYYVYGSSFHQYLADKYGEQKFAELYALTGSSLESYLNPIYSGLSLDAAYKQTYGKTTPKLWTDWQAEMGRNAPPLPKKKISSHGWRTDNLQYHAGALYYTNYKVSKTGPSSTFSSHRLIRVDDPYSKPRQEILVEQGSEFSAGFQIDQDKLYYSSSEFEPGYANNNYDGLGVVTQVWVQDLDGGGRHQLFAGPIRAFCKLDSGQFLIAEDDATHQKTELSRIDPATKARTSLGSLDWLIGTIHQSQGRIYVTARRFWHNNSVYELDLGSLQLTPLIDTPYMETVASVSGNDLIFNAVYDGKNGSYLYNLKTRQISQFAGFSEVKNATQGRDGKAWFIAISRNGQDVYQDQLQLRPFSLPADRSNPEPYARVKGMQSMVLGKYPVTKGTYANNLWHMLWPRLYRMPYIGNSDKEAAPEDLITQDNLVLGAQLAGADVVGDFPLWTATVLYDLGNEDWGYQFGVENNFFRPVKQTLQYTDLDSKSLSSIQSVSLLQRMNYGLTGLNLGFGFVADEDTLSHSYRKLLYPFLGANFAYKGIRLQTSNRLMYEDQNFLASDRERLGWQGQYAFRLKAPLSTELRSSVFAAYDPEANKDEVFPAMRGYDSDWLLRSGALVRNTWYAPILKVRNGIWTPNIYLEDINLGLFYDFANPWNQKDGLSRYSYGAELIAELFAGYNFGLNLGVRYSVNKDQESMLSLILGM